MLEAPTHRGYRVTVQDREELKLCSFHVSSLKTKQNELLTKTSVKGTNKPQKGFKKFSQGML